MNRPTLWTALLLCLLPPAALRAHPVARSAHDRTVDVRLTAGAGRVHVAVRYRLEVDELTMVLDDVAPFADRLDLTKYRDRPEQFRDDYMELYAPILADNLIATADGEQVQFTCTDRRHTIKDEKGESLGHVRCDFLFEGGFAAEPGHPYRFNFREANYELQPGKVTVALGAGPGLEVQDLEQASEELKNLPLIELPPGGESALRSASATVVLPPEPGPPPEGPPPESPPAEPQGGASPHAAADVGEHSSGLGELFQSTEHSVPALLFLSFLFGAAHALTPGHGKTLVAAYLVGERGTSLHAVVLGVVTTLTHTGIVLILAALLPFLYTHTDLDRRDIHAGLGLTMGLVVVCLGFWLLLQRLSGRPDHVHLPGTGHHHHHHGHGGHHHHGHDHTHANHDHAGQGQVIPKARPGWWGLIILGVSGGIVPCWDAVLLLLVAVGTSLFWLALPMLVAFSAGLAGVLVAVGLLVVKVKGFAAARATHNSALAHVTRSLPVVSALAIIALGAWLSYHTVHGVTY